MVRPKLLNLLHRYNQSRCYEFNYISTLSSSKNWNTALRQQMNANQTRVQRLRDLCNKIFNGASENIEQFVIGAAAVIPNHLWTRFRRKCILVLRFYDCCVISPSFEMINYDASLSTLAWRPSVQSSLFESWETVVICSHHLCNNV